ncbi:uncharacterized protein C2845_PM15G09260 [Panicum miliaceum]|uniref:F-box domain-containing protein n=1 Tax=Panicum miliaceum TaxID=4540 RepID=A0A3L6Q865_PANMI|nr:uncharacterized protein C2845_PM15G09260 [Panicum miliaceum]
MGSTSIQPEHRLIRMQAAGPTHAHMHVRERDGRRTGAPWSRGHVSGDVTRRPGPTDAGAGIDALPSDILADEVLRRLRAHSLARCRCVCALWRALVDGHGLLLPHALPPRAFPGFFANARVRSWGRPGPGFLPPPASRAPAPDRLAFLRAHLPHGGAEAAVRHQCNGLVLCFQDAPRAAGFVCNPTTERWARLPPPPTWWPRGHEGLFLAFDPAVSLGYEVLLLPVPPPRQGNGGAGLPAESPRQGRVTLGMFVPESFGKQEEGNEEKLLPLLVFSSATRQWTKRLLAPGRCAPPRLYDRVMRRRRRSAEGDPWVRTWRSAVYRRGALYAHCEKRILVVLRSSSEGSEGTYDMVKLPADTGAGQGERYAAGHVLSSLPVDSIFPSTEDGVLLRYASVDAFRVKAWALHDSGGNGGGPLLEWTLTHDTDLAAHARMLDLLHDAPSNCVPLAAAAAAAAKIGEHEVLDVGAGAPSPFSVLGCHPDKEVIFLAAGAFHVVAYHLGSGKVQYLGRVMSPGDGDRLEGVLPYRPCIVDALPHDSW